jgi:hypothetical protein
VWTLRDGTRMRACGEITCRVCGYRPGMDLLDRIVAAVNAASARGVGSAKFDVEAIAPAGLDAETTIRRAREFMTALRDQLAELGLHVVWVWTLELGPLNGTPHVHGILMLQAIAGPFDATAHPDIIDRALAATVEALGQSVGRMTIETMRSVVATARYMLKHQIGLKGGAGRPAVVADPARHVEVNGGVIAQCAGRAKGDFPLPTLTQAHVKRRPE